jgi:hypothetical protein
MVKFRKLSILGFLLVFLLSACQVIESDKWQTRFSEWGDELDKQAWQLGIMFGLEIPRGVQINSIDKGRIAFVANSLKDDVGDAIFVLGVNRQLSKIVEQANLPEGMEFNGDVFWDAGGERLAFASHKLCPLDDGSAIRCEGAVFVIGVATQELRRISSNEEFADSPVWSADGELLMYRVMDVEDPTSDDYFSEWIDGGGRIRLSETPGQTVSWGQWSPTQSYFSYLASDEEISHLQLLSLNSEDGQSQRFDLSYFGSDGNAIATAVALSGIHWSPDGKYIAFSNGPETVAQRQNFVIDVRSGEISPLSADVGLLVFGWLDGRTIFAEDHLQGIVSVNLEGEVTALVDGVLFPASQCALSPGEDQVILSHYDSNFTIPQVDIYKNFVWDLDLEEVSTRIDLVDYSAGKPCWSE